MTGADLLLGLILALFIAAPVGALLGLWAQDLPADHPVVRAWERVRAVATRVFSWPVRRFRKWLHDHQTDVYAAVVCGWCVRGAHFTPGGGDLCDVDWCRCPCRGVWPR